MYTGHTEAVTWVHEYSHMFTHDKWHCATE